MADTSKLSVREKFGYGAGDAAANFVFMTMILFQPIFYTQVFGISAGAAASILLIGRLWDAVVDPLVGALADRTNTRWGKFRPWIAATAVPWCVAMVLAYSTPGHSGLDAKIAYAVVTNILLMSLYSMNNMPYAALGGVMTADPDERASLNSYRFACVNAAQFVVAGFTLPLVGKFSNGRSVQFAWQATIAVWASICLILFTITFLSTRERISPLAKEDRDLTADAKALVRSGPWIVIVAFTLIHFAILAFHGAALYGYYHVYADQRSMGEWLRSIGLMHTAVEGTCAHGVLATLGLLVCAHGGAAMRSQIADVFNSIANMLNLGVTTLAICASPLLCRRFGKKAVAVSGFLLTGLGSLSFFYLRPSNVDGMLALTVLSAIFYAPTIPVVWAMYADVADYCEWTSGRRCTGVVFATLCFSLKCGLALGSAGLLWVMASTFGYGSASAVTRIVAEGYRVCNGLAVGIAFLVCAGLLCAYKLNRDITLRMAGELRSRRQQSHIGGEALLPPLTIPERQLT